MIRPVLSIVFSFRNEAQILCELVTRVRKAMLPLVQDEEIANFEMIFVDDDSTDDSAALLRELSQGHDDIRIITTSRPFGVSPCALLGMEHAAGDVLVYMDADLQDPPELIPKLIQTWKCNPDLDVVHTVRLSRAGESRTKLLLTAIGYRVLKMVSEVNLPIQAGDFKLLSRRSVDHLIALREHRPYLRGLVSWVGFKSATVSYHREKRFAGSTKFTVISSKVIKNFLDSALIAFSDIPLKLTMAFGFLCSIAALGYIAWIVFEKYQGHNLPGWSAIMATVLFLGGVQLISIGVLGLYVGAIFVESKGRPNYIVKQTFGFSADHTPPLPSRYGLNKQDI